jgi:endonuclease YncB( thermonuclease family)
VNRSARGALAIVLAALVALPAAACAQADKDAKSTKSEQPIGTKARMIEGRATVVDGDGLEIAGIKIRLFGIDAPEVEQYCTRSDGARWRCGQYATVALDRLAGGKDVTCAVRSTDHYGRPVAVCTIPNNRDLAAEQAREGWALAYRRYSKDYVDEETAASSAKSGVWVGRFEAPWDWRRRTQQSGHAPRTK